MRKRGTGQSARRLPNQLNYLARQAVDAADRRSVRAVTRPERPRWTLRLTIYAVAALCSYSAYASRTRFRMRSWAAASAIGRSSVNAALLAVDGILTGGEGHVAAGTAAALPDPESNQLEALERSAGEVQLGVCESFRPGYLCRSG